MLIIHNLKAGWRNILKYKVQNTISVLCLSVGVICFAISLYFINVLWHNAEHLYFQDNRMECCIRAEGKSKLKAIDLSDIEKIKKLNSVEDVIYRCDALYSEFFFKDKTAHKRNYNFGLIVVSPNWLEDNNFRSAVTGKKIGRLKPGTLVMDETSAKRLYGEENFKADAPIGAKILNMKKQRVVSDVVYSTCHVGLRGNMYLVADQEAITEGHEICDIDYILKDGVKAEQFESEMKELFSGHTLTCSRYYAKDSVWTAAMLIFLVFLGASVLIIGISGYLKMQLQLFMLRSREMSLRRCNGAKPYQLFMLLCSEILIVFCIIAIMSILLTLGFEEYAMPLLQKFGMTDQLDIHTDVIYCTEIHIIIITFLSALGIAWLTVRKTMKSPLSKTVGRSYTQHTLWNGSMQVTQYLVTTILFFVIALVFYGVYTQQNNKYHNIDTDYYKNVIVTYSDKYDEAAKLPSVKLKAECRQFHEYIPTKEDSIISHIIPRAVENDTIRHIRWSMVDAEYFKISKLPITEKPKDEHAINPPIFVSASEADSIKNILSIKHKTSDELHTLADGNEYVIIGYVPYRRIGLPGSSDYYLIKDYGKWQKETEHPEHNPSYTLLILPKDNDADKYNAEYNEMLHRMHKDLPSDYKYKNMTVYDASFMELQIFKFIIQLLYILTITSIVCIIMTIYSSISLETRGKQKDVAIRKVNGAKTHDIVMLFSRYYIVTLSIAFTIALLIGIAVIVAFCLKGGWNIHDDDIRMLFKIILEAFLGCIFTITLVTILTVWQKIYKISHINPALLIKKE